MNLSELKSSKTKTAREGCLFVLPLYMSYDLLKQNVLQKYTKKRSDFTGLPQADAALKPGHWEGSHWGLSRPVTQAYEETP